MDGGPDARRNCEQFQERCGVDFPHAAVQSTYPAVLMLREDTQFEVDLQHLHVVDSDLADMFRWQWNLPATSWQLMPAWSISATDNLTVLLDSLTSSDVLHSEDALHHYKPFCLTHFGWPPFAT